MHGMCLSSFGSFITGVTLITEGAMPNLSKNLLVLVYVLHSNSLSFNFSLVMNISLVHYTGAFTFI